MLPKEKVGALIRCLFKCFFGQIESENQSKINLPKRMAKGLYMKVLDYNVEILKCGEILV